MTHARRFALGVLAALAPPLVKAQGSGKIRVGLMRPDGGKGIESVKIDMRVGTAHAGGAMAMDEVSVRMGVDRAVAIPWKYAAGESSGLRGDPALATHLGV